MQGTWGWDRANFLNPEENIVLRLYIRFVDPGTVVSYHHKLYHHLEEDVGEEGDSQGKDGEQVQCEADDLINPGMEITDQFWEQMWPHKD